MLEVIIENYKPIGKIIFYSTFFIIVFAAMFYKMYKEHILENWHKYRSNPLFLPFAGFINPEKGVSGLRSTINNFIKVLWNIVKKFLGILMTPIYPILNIFLKVFKSLTGVLNGIRGQINVIRNFLFKLFEKMYLKLQNGVATIAFFFLKLRESMKRSYGLMTVLIYAIEHSFIFFESMVKSPLGKFGKLSESMGVGASIFTFGSLGIPMWHSSMCFSPDTLIELDSGDKVEIKNINIGDILKNGNKVLATMSLNNTYNMYMLDNIIVSGDHLVKDNNVWKRVENINRSVKIRGDIINSIVCLVTKSGIIEINNLVFRDYLDSHDKNVNRIVRQLVENSLNDNIKYKKQYRCNDLLYGIHPDTKITNREDIIGEIRIDKDIIDTYKYNGEILSGNILVYYKMGWRRVADLEEVEYLGKNKVSFVHFISKTEKIETNNIVIRDFCESNKPSLNDKIDLFVEYNLNNNIQ